ncbi:MAG: V-type ATP synthase subunit A, partial [Candidatus Krumholzibacteriota bacterium]|nr:V-type ATP synthase subunit A [Candidatus Krumholzibacteriota bacterium]
FRNEVSEDWRGMRTEAMTLLQKESDLNELVRLVGVDALSGQDRIVLETAKMIREDFLHQSAFDPDDAYTRLLKQYRMLGAIMEVYRASARALERGVPVRKLLDLPVREKIARMRLVKEDSLDEFDAILADIETEIAERSAEARSVETE